MNRQVRVLGDSDAVLGFALVGIGGVATDDPQVASASLQAWGRDPDVGLILITTGLAGKIRPQLDRLMAAASLPLIYEIPDRQARPEQVPLRDLVRRMLGVSI